MSDRLTLSDAKGTIAGVLGVGTADSRVAQYLNEAQRRLMDRGQWVGTILRYVCCVASGCLTWPRQIETIESYAICDYPGIVRNKWYEFLGNGTYGHKSDECDAGLLIDRGFGVGFDNICGTDKKIKVYADVAEDANAQILLQYWDTNGTWVRTLSGGSYIDGELIDLDNATPQFTTYELLANGLVGVQKPVTNGTIRLYEYDTTDASEKALAIYEPDETRPQYRKSLIPGLENMGACCDSDTDCENIKVTVMAKLKHIDVSIDRDWLILQNLPALKLAVMAIKAEEQNHFDKSDRLFEGKFNAVTRQMEGGAIPLLQAELGTHNGTPHPAIRYEDGEIFGCGGI